MWVRKELRSLAKIIFNAFSNSRINAKLNGQSMNATIFDSKQSIREFFKAHPHFNYDFLTQFDNLVYVENITYKKRIRVD